MGRDPSRLAAGLVELWDRDLSLEATAALYTVARAILSVVKLG